MKKYIVFMFALITAHLHGMETENATLDITLINLHHCNILDLITQFLPFHDVETEDEFIARTKALESLEGAKMPEKYLTQLAFDGLDFEHIKGHGYCPNNTLVGVLHETPDDEYTMMGPKLYLSIINRKKEKENPQAVHKIKEWTSIFRQMALSCNGNWVAVIGSVMCHSEYPGSEALRMKDVLTITNLSTKEKKQHDAKGVKSICFNKQSTDIILHHFNYPHVIIPLTTTPPDGKEQPQKTFAKYCAQRGICKNILEQLK